MLTCFYVLLRTFRWWRPSRGGRRRQEQQMQERCQAAKESHDGACAAARAAKIPTMRGSCGSSRCGVGYGWRVAPNTRVTLRTPFFYDTRPAVRAVMTQNRSWFAFRIILIRCCSLPVLPVLQSFDAVRCQSCLPLVQFSPSSWFHYSTVLLSAVTIVLLKCTESVGRS